MTMPRWMLYASAAYVTQFPHSARVSHEMAKVPLVFVPPVRWNSVQFRFRKSSNFVSFASAFETGLGPCTEPPTSPSGEGCAQPASNRAAVTTICVGPRTASKLEGTLAIGVDPVAEPV